ncbi:hypothetical protein G9P44_006305 [Scheffersomyces stipitis]|nr:hypothetical protein G9P44_006305 [Scheffersomyces stipitis]
MFAINPYFQASQQGSTYDFDSLINYLNNVQRQQFHEQSKPKIVKKIETEDEYQIQVYKKTGDFNNYEVRAIKVPKQFSQQPQLINVILQSAKDSFKKTFQFKEQDINVEDINWEWYKQENILVLNVPKKVHVCHSNSFEDLASMLGFPFGAFGLQQQTQKKPTPVAMERSRSEQARLQAEAEEIARKESRKNKQERIKQQREAYENMLRQQQEFMNNFFGPYFYFGKTESPAKANYDSDGESITSEPETSSERSHPKESEEMHRLHKHPSLEEVDDEEFVLFNKKSGEPPQAAIHQPWIKEVNWEKGNIFEPSTYTHSLSSFGTVVHSIGMLFENSSYKEDDELELQLLERHPEFGFTAQRAQSMAKDDHNTYEAIQRDSAYLWVFDYQREAEFELSCKKGLRSILMRPGFMYDPSHEGQDNRDILARLLKLGYSTKEVIVGDKISFLNKSVRPPVTTEQVASKIFEKIENPNFSGVVSLDEIAGRR